MKLRFRIVVLLVGMLVAVPVVSQAALISFDDVVGSQVDITNRYVGLGVTLNAIDNPFPLSGPFPAPLTLPAIRGGVTTWTDGFASATSPSQVAVAAPTPQTGEPGRGGILISFAFDVSTVSLVGNDLGGIGFGDDESVTLTGYDAAGNRIGQVYFTANLPGNFDQTPATINLPGMRFVAFNYTDSQFGFYAIDDLAFTQGGGAVPEPGTILLLSSGLIGLTRLRRQRKS